DASAARRGHARPASPEGRRPHRLAPFCPRRRESGARLQSVARSDDPDAEGVRDDLAGSRRRRARHGRDVGQPRRRAGDRRRPGRRVATRGPAREPPHAAVGGLPPRRASLRRLALHHAVTAASAARAVAARVLERVLVDRAYADLALDGELGRRRLSLRDVALATELVYGTLRWQRYLDWILAPHSRRNFERLDPGTRVLLRMTAYQIVFLDRVPAFAAVSDAVTLARGACPPGAAGSVTAML